MASARPGPGLAGGAARQDRDDDREHRGGRRGVGHEHRQQRGDRHQAEHGAAGVAGERPQQHGGEVAVEVELAGAVRDQEAAEEQHDDGSASAAK
jgi:hypothetical protein